MRNCKFQFCYWKPLNVCFDSQLFEQNNCSHTPSDTHFLHLTPTGDTGHQASVHCSLKLAASLHETRDSITCEELHSDSHGSQLSKKSKLKLMHFSPLAEMLTKRKVEAKIQPSRSLHTDASMYLIFFLLCIKIHFNHLKS